MPYTEEESRDILKEWADRFHGVERLTQFDLITLEGLMKGSTQERWQTMSGDCRNECMVVSDKHGVIAENITLTDMCFVVAAHGAFGGLLALAKEALDNHRNTPAFQPKAKVGDTVWTTRYGVVEDEGHERNIGYEVLIEERKIVEIVWNGEAFSYMLFKGLESEEALNEAELTVARDPQQAILAERAAFTNRAQRPAPDNFIRVREETRDRSYL